MAKQQMNDDLGATSATQRMGSAPLPAQRSVSRPWTPPAGMGGACIHPKRPPAPLCATLPIQSPLPFPWRLPVGATFTVDPLTLVLLLVFTFTTGKYCLLLSPPASLPVCLQERDRVLLVNCSVWICSAQQTAWYMEANP